MPRRDSGGKCHGPNCPSIKGLKKVFLVGSPNVGKSSVFNSLTKSYVTVSNYPGTTVTLDTGKARIGGEDYEIIDTPGMYSMNPITEEERISRDLIIEERPHKVVHVVDAKNIDKMLHLTIELVEANLPVILVLNMMDEAEKKGLDIDAEALGRELGIPVVKTVSTTGRGMTELRTAIAEDSKKNMMMVGYSPLLEKSISEMEKLLPSGLGISKRSASLLVLRNTGFINALVADNEKKSRARKIASRAQESYSKPLNYLVTIERQNRINEILEKVVNQDHDGRVELRERLSHLMMNPVTGIPIFLAVIYFGLYQFVGVFGAGELVDFLEAGVFEKFVNPAVNSFVGGAIPWPIIQDLIGHDYGIITLGFRYAVAIIFPIVATFFIFFSIIEDSGYLPRLAMMIDRLFKGIGLNGRAVIPMVLGFGCDTMATIVTRTQETKKERVITTLLLALAIPCSAQLGVIFGILSPVPGALVIWIFSIIAVFVLIGFLASKVIPGEKPYFYMEVPPLRMPHISNVLIKTYTRMVWYFKEVMPIFVLASVLIWFGVITGIFDMAIQGLSHVVAAIGLPVETSKAFLYGFFRRDYGAAGLYDIQATLSGVQLAVAAVTLTLFIPCIAQVSVMLKERGWKSALAMVAFIFPFAFLVGWALNAVLMAAGVVL